MVRNKLQLVFVSVNVSQAAR